MVRNKTNGIDNATRKTVYADKAMKQIREEIVTGKLRPRERLFEYEIAERLKMSRTPVHEALKILEAQGYLSRIRRGMIVADQSIDQTNIKSTYEVLELLESTALKLACKRATDKQIERVVQLATRVSEAIRNRDADKFFKLDQVFHSELLSCCNNDQLISTINTFHERYFRLTNMKRSTTDWARIRIQHKRLIDALCAHDPKSAEKAVKYNMNILMKLAIERSMAI